MAPFGTVPSAHDDVIKWKHFRFTGLCEGNPLVTRGFPQQGPVTQSFDIFFDQRPNKRLSKQSRRRWSETPSHSLWRRCKEARWFFSSHHSIRDWQLKVLELLQITKFGDAFKWRLQSPLNEMLSCLDLLETLERCDNIELIMPYYFPPNHQREWNDTWL